MLCVIAKLDDAGTADLAAIQKAVFPDAGAFKPLHGHITLAAYVGDDETGFIQSCRELMAGLSSFDVEYEKIEILDETSVIVATPKRSDDLDHLHQIIAVRYNDRLDQWTKIGRWYPHTTLFFGPVPDLDSIRHKMERVFVPFRASVCRIEFSRVLETGYEIADRIEL